MTAVDTNVFVGLLAGTEDEAEVAQRALEKAVAEGPLLLCPAVYAELLAMPGMSEGELDTFVDANDLTVEWVLQSEVWRAAGRAYAAYATRRRKQKGDKGPRRILADFVIGAHATLTAGKLLTLDPNLYRANFVGLEIIVPI
ncbi:type II toxin-antitoxin system VapC family toxin [soil metagenome]